MGTSKNLRRPPAAVKRPARILSSPLLRVYIALIVVYAVSCMVSPAYFSMDYINTLLLKTAPFGIVCIGQTLVILNGGIDMSICYNVTLSAVVLTQVVQGGHPVLACLLAVAMTTVTGLINGVGISCLEIPPIIMTLAMNMILQSVTMIYTNGTPKGTAPAALGHFINADYLGLRGGIWIWILMAVIASFVLHKTAFGRVIYALGSNISTAKFSGIRQKKMQILVYGLSGAMCGLAAIMSTGYSGRSYLTMASDYNLMTVSAVVLGGTSIAGGKGSYLGTIAGAIILEIVLAVLTVVQIDQSGKDLIYGGIILAMLLLYSKKKAA